MAKGKGSNNNSSNNSDNSKVSVKINLIGTLGDNNIISQHH